MQNASVEAKLRTQAGKGVARKLRAKGQIPGVLYGLGQESVLLELDPKQLVHAVSGKSGMNTVIELDVATKGKTTVLLKDYQADNLTRDFTHADFIRLDLTQKIDVEIPIEISGKAEGVKEGGILEMITRKIHVRCLPTTIPEHITVDVTHLKVGQSIHLNELKLPEGIEVPPGVNYTLISIVAPKEEVAKAPGEGPKEPEVLTAKKPAEDKADAKSDKDKK